MENNNENKNGVLEFHFDPPEQTGGLVFEVEKAAKAEDKAVPTPPVTPETKVGSEQPEKKVVAEEQGGEFTVPDSFKINEKYNTPLRSNERTRIYTTYVPRFTEVSETYRMKDDPRPRPKPAEPVVGATEQPTKESVRVLEQKDAQKTENPLPRVTEDAVVVNVFESPRDTEEDEAINIFKFPEAELSDPDRMNIEEENANRKALEELKARQAERRARAEAERLAEEEAARKALEEEKNAPLSPEDYEIPDPEHTGFVGKCAPVSIDADYDTPHGIPSDSEKARKLKVSEYTGSGQRDSFKDKFLDSLVAIKIRIAAAVLIAVLALFVGNSGALGLDVPKMLGIEYMPSAIAIIDLQLAVCAFLLTLPETVSAVKRLLRATVSCEIALPVSFLVLCIYTVIVATSKYYIDYPVFGFLFTTSALFALIASYLRKKTDFESFKFISVKGEKKIIEYEETRKYARTMLALDGAIDGYKSNTAKTFRTTFISDFFTSSSKTALNSKNNVIMLLSALGVAIVCALVTFFTSDTAALLQAFSAFVLVLTFAVPAVSYILHALPYYYAGKEVAAENSAFIGECAYTDAAGIDVIAFEDTEIFGEDDVNLKRFGFYGNEDNMNKCMRLICSLFASVGGSLHIIFSKTLEKRCTPATDPVIEEDGVSGNVDGKIVSAGTAEYMQRHGIKIPEDNDRAYGGIGAESMKIMYGAEGGVVFAKFYIRYSFSEEFTSLLPELREEHIVPLVYTSDPNVSNDLFRTLTMGADCMRVMKRKKPHAETEKIYPRLRASIVTMGDKINAIRLVLISRKYKRFLDKLVKAEIITMAAGTALTALLSVFGLISVPTLALGAVQLISCGVLWLFTRRKFDTSKKYKGN